METDEKILKRARKLAKLATRWTMSNFNEPENTELLELQVLGQAVKLAIATGDWAAANQRKRRTKPQPEAPQGG